MKVDGMYLHVVTCKVMFAGGISYVFLTWVASHVILLVFYLISDVKISHFHGEGALFYDGFIGNN